MIIIVRIYSTNINVPTNRSISVKFLYKNKTYYRWIDCREQYPIIKSLIENNNDEANLIIAKELISKIITENIEFNEKIL